MPQQLKNAMSRRLGKALPKAGASNTNQSKVSTFAKPGFAKNKLLQQMQQDEAGEADAGAPQAFQSGNKTTPNTKNLAIQRRLKKK